MAKRLTENQRQQIVDNLCTNCSCQGAQLFTENDRDLLMNTDDERLVSFDQFHRNVQTNEVIANAARKGFQAGKIVVNEAAGMLVANVEDTTGEDKLNDDDEEPNPKHDPSETHQKPLQNMRTYRTQPSRPLTDEEWMRTAPPGIRSVVQNALNFQAQQKQTLIDQITANANNTFNPEYLATKDVQELQAIAALATNGRRQIERFSQPNYLGAAAPATNQQGAPVDNTKDILELPSVNWAEVAKANRA